MIPAPDIILHWDLRISKLAFDDAGEPVLHFEIPVSLPPKRGASPAVIRHISDDLAERSDGVLKYKLVALHLGEMKGAPPSAKHIAKVDAILA